MSDITGKYQMIKSENFDEYMKKLGVGFTMRKLGGTKPVVEITNEGSNWRIQTKTTFKTTDVKFKLGEQFAEETADGRKCMSTITMDAENRMIHKQNCGPQDHEIIRSFKDNEMTMTLRADDIVATRTYKKIT